MKLNTYLPYVIGRTVSSPERDVEVLTPGTCVQIWSSEDEVFRVGPTPTWLISLWEGENL